MSSGNALGSRSVRRHVLSLDGEWSLPITEFSPERPRGTVLIFGDGGRGSADKRVKAALESGKKALAVDIFGTGELDPSYQYHMLVAAAGARSYGIMVGQLLAVVSWAQKKFPRDAVDVEANGQVLSCIGFAAAALEPRRFATLRVSSYPDSLGRLIDRPSSFADTAPLYSFGLLPEFDIPDLIELSAPVPITHDGNHGPLRIIRGRL